MEIILLILLKIQNIQMIGLIIIKHSTKSLLPPSLPIQVFFLSFSLFIPSISQIASEPLKQAILTIRPQGVSQNSDDDECTII